jgi:glycine/D-amino acid oxidase-like deaminating enzyme
VPKGTAPKALFWDTLDRYRYLRVDERPRHDYVVLGGEDHKTGQVDDTEEPFRTLEKLLVAHAPKADVNYRWSGQVIETNDRLPLGETSERQFAATVFAGSGMTFGILGSIMACDAALGRRRSKAWPRVFQADLDPQIAPASFTHLKYRRLAIAPFSAS